MNFDPLFDQRFRVLAGGLAVDAALFGFIIVNAARFLGKLVADIIGILL